MPQLIVVGAGFYGLAAAKTYLQVTGAYNPVGKEHKIKEQDLLIIDSASDIGGTWANERLYPNLLSQNSYGQYEFSDLPLATTVPDRPSQYQTQPFIPGWKINQYLHIWCHKWDLLKRIRLNWKVIEITRLPSKKWKLHIKTSSPEASELITLYCDKLILATGLTSEPNIPEIPSIERNVIPTIHSKDVGAYFRDTMGYQPIISSRNARQLPVQCKPRLQSVAIYGGAKSSFDFVHLFGSLHRVSPSFHLGTEWSSPVHVHWIIRANGHGPARMVQPSQRLAGGTEVPSDQVASTRLIRKLSPGAYEIPKRVTWHRPSVIPWVWIPQLEGSWTRRLLHGNPLGRYVIRKLWERVDNEIHLATQYQLHPKMEKLRPEASIVDCVSPTGIANQPNLWDIILSPNIHIYRSSIEKVSKKAQNPTIELTDGTQIADVDLIVHATGWKDRISINFEPRALGHLLGLPSLPSSPCLYGDHNDNDDRQWVRLEEEAERKMRQIFSPATFKENNSGPQMSYRLFRRMASPFLISEGDHSFAVLGIVSTGAVAIVPEVQALWAVAFLTGRLDHKSENQTFPNGLLSSMGKQRIYEAVAEDVTWARLTGSGLGVSAIEYNDILLRDLGLNPYRNGGTWWKELTGVYSPSSYAGIVEEWMRLRGL